MSTKTLSASTHDHAKDALYLHEIDLAFIGTQRKSIDGYSPIRTYEDTFCKLVNHMTFSFPTIFCATQNLTSTLVFSQWQCQCCRLYIGKLGSDTPYPWSLCLHSTPPSRPHLHGVHIPTKLFLFDTINKPTVLYGTKVQRSSLTLAEWSPFERVYFIIL